MKKKEDKDTRYFIDIDLKSMKIVRRSYDSRQKLSAEEPEKPHYHRIFLTKGQYNKLEQSLGK